MQQSSSNPANNRILNAAVVVSALGYFVDVFDLLLFGAVRVKSLTELGLTGQALTDASLTIQNWQMIGMFVGGIGAGMLADKAGRVRALFFSIALYSIATLLCGLAHSVEAYTFYRFLAGVGLAGELGTGITLVSESLPTHKRGLGTTIMAAFGMSGAVAAGSTSWLIADWRVAYYIGGALGLALLVLRLSVSESQIFEKTRNMSAVARGNAWALFNNPNRFARLSKSALLGATTWFNTGILMLLAPEFGVAKGIPDPVSPALAVVWFHIGMVLGDAGSGLLSQWLKSRLRAMQIFLTLQLVAILAYLFVPLTAASQLYPFILLLGFAGGFWAVFVTNASEQFGTNLRATAASTVPALVRILFVPIALAFQALKAPNMLGNTLWAAAAVGLFFLALAFWASFNLEETFDKDLDYVEH